MPYKLLLFCFFLHACTPGRLTETSLYFGQSKPGGGMLTAAEWKAFKEGQVTRVFKEGCTILEGSGNWYDPDRRQQITEPTYVVVYLYKPSRQLSQQIDSLREWYKTRFQQQSVLRVDKKVKARF